MDEGEIRENASCAHLWGGRLELAGEGGVGVLPPALAWLSAHAQGCIGG